VPSAAQGPDVIVGELSGLQQFDNVVGTQVGLAVGTDSCNNGDQPLDWFACQATITGHSAKSLSHERRS